MAKLKSLFNFTFKKYNIMKRFSSRPVTLKKHFIYFFIFIFFYFFLGGGGGGGGGCFLCFVLFMIFHYLSKKKSLGEKNPKIQPCL